MDNEAIVSEADAWAHRLPVPVEAFLRASNPWWEGHAAPRPPPFRRWLFEPILHRLKKGLTPITVLRGPRQVGKTTLQEQLIDHLLVDEGIDPRCICRIQFDEIPPFEAGGLPILRLALWFEHNVLGGKFNEWSNRGVPIFLFFDEVQNLEAWAPQMKSLVDHHRVRVFLTGSSAFRIEAGRDSLAGRIRTLEMGALHLREIAALRGWGEIEPALGVNGVHALGERSFWEDLRERGRHHELRDRAFATFAERGGYPMAQIAPEEPWEEISELLNETIIRRVLYHDLRLGEDEEEEEVDLQVLEQVFRIACRYAGQDPGPRVFVPEIRGALGLDVNWARITACLRALGDSLLLRRIPRRGKMGSIPPRDLRLRRQEQRHKLCLCDPSLRASWLGEKIALTPEGLTRDPASSRLAGALAESVLGYFLGTVPGLDVAWLPARRDEPEIDLVATVGDQLLPIEIKYRQRIDPRRDVTGLLSFIDNEINRAPFGLLVTLHDDVEIDDPRIIALPLATVLLLR